MPKALHLTPENVDAVIMLGAIVQMDLSDLKDNMEYYAEYGHELYLIMDGRPETWNVVFTHMIEADFLRHWKWKNPQELNKFVEIERR